MPSRFRNFRNGRNRRNGVAMLRLWLAAVVGVSGACAAEREPATRPNVLLITLESLRTDHVGFLGGAARTQSEVPVTPTLDALAREAVVYPDAHSVTSWTLASHASLFTGLYPTAHQTRAPLARLGDSYRTAAELLSERGYQTAGVVSGPYLRASHNLNQGFVHWDEEAAAPTHGLGHADVTNPHMEAALLRFLETERDPARPFFLFAYFWDPHFDFIPPAPYDEMFVDEGCEPFDASSFDTNEAIRADMSPHRLAWLLAQYAGEVRATDAVLARVFERMRTLGLWDDTLVLVTADHGEEFFDHGAKGHKNNLHAETVHVPLMIKWPAGLQAAPTPGTRDARLVSLVDVLPTLLELTGGPAADPGEQAGRSLLAAADPERAILFELLSSEYRQHATGEVERLLSASTGVRHRSFKLLAEKPSAAAATKLRLYDVLADPTERFDRSAAEAETMRALGAHHDRLRAEAQRVAARHEPGGQAELGEQERAQLCALGYIDC